MARLNPSSPTKPAKLQERRTPPAQRNLNRTATIKRDSRDNKYTATAKAKTVEQWAAADETWTKSRYSATTPAIEEPSQRKNNNRLQRSGTVSSGVFDIFSDNGDEQSETEDSSFSSTRSLMSNEGRTTDPLKLSQINSLLLPLSQQSRNNRPPRKSVGYNYDKENDPIDDEAEEADESSGLSRNSSTASNRAPTRNTNREVQPRGRSRTRYMGYRREETESEAEESEENNGFDSMDDFIVSDNEEISYHETSDDESIEEEQEEKQPTPSPPRTRKRLLRGRRPRPEIEPETTPQVSPRESLDLEPSVPATMTMEVPKLEAKPKSLFQSELEISEKLNKLKLDNKDIEPQLDEKSTYDSIEEVDAPTKKLPSRDSVQLETPPSSPTKGRSLRSPTKLKAHIPPTPHRESVDAFWSQENTNNWIDQHSPCKIDDLLREFDDSDSDDEFSDREIMPKTATPKTTTKSSTRTPSKTAMKKAEAEQRKLERERAKAFMENRQAMAEQFFKVLDDTVTDGRLSRMTASTGGVIIEWKKRLQTTAGRASWKCVTPSPKKGGDPAMPPQHYATIELAAKVVDCEERIIKTVAHEFCHLANYMISGVHDNPHGASFKAWGRKCKEAMKNHPVYGGKVEVSIKHDYAIDYKYVWRCVHCNLDYGRHSKSIDPKRHRCRCQGVLQQIQPKVRNVSPLKKSVNAPAPSVRGLLNEVGRVLNETQRQT
ncbi:hypothetical protein AnigIFM60653_006368 [Aspergillus niger]|nr:hypothetical protein AnigIFM60653_006368 [Aspergillus niger]GLA21461.1 hypothetical protein AnigIFM62618_010772 [Aspergillus niger]GLA36385.1 hypothetical protein AnigIFM63309_002483 [Aspergillus niger]